MGRSGARVWCACGGGFCCVDIPGFRATYQVDCHRMWHGVYRFLARSGLTPSWKFPRPFATNETSLDIQRSHLLSWTYNYRPPWRETLSASCMLMAACVAID